MNAYRSALLIGAASILMAASDPSKFYQAVPHRSPDAEITADPVFHASSGDAKGDVTSMETRGFELIGYSAFNGRESGQKAIAKQAKKIGATDVVYLEKYTETENTGAIGNTSLSRRGAFSFITPMSVRRYDQLAMYFRKASRHGLGVFPRELTDEEKIRIGSNKGLVITAVVNGSPAFVSDILPGDIITEFDGRPVWDGDSLQAAIDAARGRPATISIRRGDQPLSKEVTVPQGDW